MIYLISNKKRLCDISHFSSEKWDCMINDYSAIPSPLLTSSCRVRVHLVSACAYAFGVQYFLSTWGSQFKARLWHQLLAPDFCNRPTPHIKLQSNLYLAKTLSSRPCDNDPDRLYCLFHNVILNFSGFLTWNCFPFYMPEQQQNSDYLPGGLWSKMA